MRENDVHALICHAKANLPPIEREYAASLHRKSIDPVLRIEVKNLMENLRSSLDYLARDIYEGLGMSTPDIIKVYFPYGKDRQDFMSSIGNRLPTLNAVNPNLFSIVESAQPHKCGSAWLYNLCRIVNDNKHNQLDAQTKTEQMSYDVGLPGKEPNISADAGAVRAREVIIDGKLVPFDTTSWTPIPVPGLQTTITKWVSFHFTGTGVEVLPLLNTAISEIDSLAKKVYSALGIQYTVQDSGIYRAGHILFCESLIESVGKQYTIVNVFDRVLWEGAFPAVRKMAVVGVHPVRQPGEYEFRLRVQSPTGQMLEHLAHPKITITDSIGYGWVYFTWEFIVFPISGDYVFILECNGREYGRRVLPVVSISLVV
jgi:hypothetical protein